MKKCIQWRNIHSNETGFVKTVSHKNGYFVNTFNQDEARQYASVAAAEKAIKALIEMGEGVNNVFTVCDVA